MGEREGEEIALCEFHNTPHTIMPTGPVEEVTPWDLFPGPIHLSKPTGPVEDVTPWEVMPGPLLISQPPSTKSSHKKLDNISLKSLPTPAYNNPHPMPPFSPSRCSLPHSDSSHHSVAYSIVFPTRSQSLSQFHEGHEGTHSKPPMIPPPPLFPTASRNRSKSLRPTPTGPMSEVTPWELHDPDKGVPDDMSHSSSFNEDKEVIEHGQELEFLYDFKNINLTYGQSLQGRLSGSVASLTAGSSRGGMSLEQVEEVTPWELYPAPTPLAKPKADGMMTRPSTASGSKSTLFHSSLGDTTTTTTTITNGSINVGAHSSTSRTLAEFGIRRRRSTGTSNKTKGSMQSNVKGVSSSTANPPSDAVHVHSSPVGPLPAGPSTQTGANGHLHPPPSPSRTTPHPVSFPSSNPRPHAPSLSTAHSNGSANTCSSKHSNQSAETKPKPKFSTADRTILEELTASIRAREEQFVLKGIGNTVVGGGRSPGKRHHRWKKDEVPYPRSYEREVIDLDVWETMFCLEICESLTWHVLEEPPTKVLELGCGTGTWTLHCARTWKQCHFVGVDVVPLHPDLQNVGSPDLASRITWMQHNFLDGLPFQNEEFDFVHIKRIALGVPEDQWDPLFAEILRVMKPGGAFEMVEEDLFFPGKPVDDKDDLDDDDFGATCLYHSNSSEQVNEDVPTTQARVSMRLTTPQIPANVGSGRGRSRSGSPTRSRAATDAAGSQHAFPRLNIPHGPPGVIASPSNLKVKSTEPTSHIPFGEPDPLSALGITLLGMAVTGSLTDAMKQRGRSTSTLTTGTSAHSVNSSGGAPVEPQAQAQQSPQSNAPGGLVATGASGSKVAASPPLSAAPTNPRDHSVLEGVWNGMLASRFINTSPLSMLPNYLGIHFKDVRTHPPLMYTFPTVLPRMYSSDEEDDKEEKEEAGDSEPDTDDARDAVVPRPKKPRSIKSSRKSISAAPHSDGRGESTEDHRWMSMQALLRRSSPYISQDDLRGYAYAPSNRVSSPPRKSKDGKLLTVRRTSRLPNPTLNIDFRTLNLHLALRAKEIIACSESMWEWVEQYQAESKAESIGGLGPLQACRNRSGSLGAGLMTVNASASRSSLNVTKDALQYMTRDDFDQLLGNFSMDMQDQAGLGNAMRERFDWDIFPSPVLQDRKVFNIACKKYDKWVEEEKAKSPSHPYYAQSSPGLVPPLPDTHGSGMMARSISTPQPNGNVNRPSTDDTHSVATTVTSHHRSEPAYAPHSPSASHPPIQSMSTQRLSRAVRVFVGWKAT